MFRGNENENAPETGLSRFSGEHFAVIEKIPMTFAAHAMVRRSTWMT
jgi:hypothetical protein